MRGLDLLGRTLRASTTDRVSLVAAGCAFYATLALFPAISMLISVYGLVFDPLTAEPQLALLRAPLPPGAYQLISERVHMLVTRQPGSLGIRLLFSTAVALWSSATGVKSIVTALTRAYEERDGRSFLHYQLAAFAVTACAIMGSVVGLSLLVGLPALMGF